MYHTLSFLLQPYTLPDALFSRYLIGFVVLLIACRAAATSRSCAAIGINPVDNIINLLNLCLARAVVNHLE